MISIKRRRVVAGIGAAVAAAMSGFGARAAMGPNDKFDFLIKGGKCSIRARACAPSATSACATA